MTSRWIIGLASGSSADGVDAALVEVEGLGLELRSRLVHSLHQPFNRDLSDLLSRVAKGRCETREVSLLHRLIGETFAAAARQAADGASFSLQKVQCIGCSGHTVWGEPDGRFPSLLSVGMPAVVAERTGVTTVADFRARDLAAGGQGAPLAALADYLLFRAVGDEGRLLIHLGGTAQVIYLSPNGRVQDVIGFEAGPCNVLLDALMRQLTGGQENFDNGGKHAVQGRCIEPLLQRWLGHPFLQRRPPKSLAWHSFAEPFAVQIVRHAKEQQWNPFDVLCTATHFVARTVSSAVERFVTRRASGSERVFLSGGGTRNGLLWHLLEQQLGDGKSLECSDVAGVPWQARRAMVMAVLAALTMDGVPANVPQATGAAGSRLLGSLTPGSAANWARCLSWMASTSPITNP
jgi:anhydro-N-acetylmuramic acid kinase